MHLHNPPKMPAANHILACQEEENKQTNPPLGQIFPHISHNVLQKFKNSYFQTDSSVL